MSIGIGGYTTGTGGFCAELNYKGTLPCDIFDDRISQPILYRCPASNWRFYHFQYPEDIRGQTIIPTKDIYWNANQALPSTEPGPPPPHNVWMTPTVQWLERVTL